MSGVLQMAKEAFPTMPVNAKLLGTTVKQVFPNVTRQHGNGPYSYCGLKSRHNVVRLQQHESLEQLPNEKSMYCHEKESPLLFESGPALEASNEVMDCVLETNDASVQVAPKQNTVECQAMMESVYNFPRSLFVGIPKDRFLDRSMLSSINPGDTFLGEGTFSIVHKMQYRKFAVAVKEYKESADMTLKWIRNRIAREAKILLSLSPHESIPMMFGVILNSRPFSLVLQLCTRNNQCLTLLRLMRNNEENIDDLQIVTIMANLA